jgi:hypothetical protein
LRPRPAALPHEVAVVWLLGAVLAEQHDEWHVARGSLSAESLANLDPCATRAAADGRPPSNERSPDQEPRAAKNQPVRGHYRLLRGSHGAPSNEALANEGGWRHKPVAAITGDNITERPSVSMPATPESAAPHHRYDPNDIEPRWQARWNETHIY